MDEFKANITINIELKDSDFLREINDLSARFTLSLEQIITFSVKKLIDDVRYIDNIRTAGY